LSSYIVGVDIGGTNIRIGAVDSNAQLTNEKIFSSQKFQGEDAAYTLLGYLKEYILALESPVQALSLGFPSTIDKERHTVINTPNLIGFNNIAVKSIYERALGIPVFINKDATMLLHYDMYKLGINNNGIIIGIYVGTGIGNSIIVDGREFTGNDGVACELGHIPVAGRDDLCGCGLKGCIELYAGGKGLERIRVNEFPETPVELLFVKHSDTPVLREFINEIANAVVTEINILNPKCVVLGGGVLQMQAFPKDLLKKAIVDKTRRPIPGDMINIAFSEDENPYNGVVGAALYAANF